MGNSRPRASPDLGAVIADTYTIEALLGRGGMGSVFLASHTRLPGKRVAIKLLHVELTGDDVIARFRREALIASQLDHPNIVRVDDYNVTEDGTPYLVLEYLEGESLAQRLKAGPLPLEQVQAILRMVGSAVAAAHRGGIIHRDLKPQNIFLMPTEIDGQLVEVAKVLDFGISKMRGRDTVQTQESTLLGTPQYMAPEQATGNHAAVDERTDVFALGAITYEMLTGRPAFSGENIPEVVFKVVYEQPTPLPAELPPDIAAAIQRAMQKNQDARFPSAAAFVEAMTGRPLVQKQSMISIPPRDAPSSPDQPTRQAAFANTVDSGSVAKATVSPHAETIASQRGEAPSPTAPMVELAAGEPSSTGGTVEPPAPRSEPSSTGTVEPPASRGEPSSATSPAAHAASRRGLVIGLAIACAVAIAAVVVVVATRDNTATTAASTSSNDADPRGSDYAAAASHDAGTAVGGAGGPAVMNDTDEVGTAIGAAGDAAVASAAGEVGTAIGATGDPAAIGAAGNDTGDAGARSQIAGGVGAAADAGARSHGAGDAGARSHIAGSPGDAKLKPPPASGGGATITRPKGDPIVAEHLRKARAAYAANQYEQAKLHCNAVVGSTAASTAQVDEALLMRGTIYCKHLRNIGLAQGDIRSIASSSVRAQLRARCKL